MLIRFHRFALTAFPSAAAHLLGRPAHAGPPFITDDPEPVDLGHWEVYAFSAGAAGPGDASGVGPSVEVNYGGAEPAAPFHRQHRL
jgi:hypothetical protein